MAEETEEERRRREASDRAFNERQDRRSPFGNADPYPDVGNARSPAPSVNPDWQSEVPADGTIEAEQAAARPSLPPRGGGYEPTATADTQGYAPAPPPGSINIGTAWSGGMGQGPAASSPVQGQIADGASPYGGQGVYGQVGWQQEGGRPAAEGPGPAYASGPGDWSLPLRDSRFEGPMPMAGSPRHLAEQRALEDDRLHGAGQFGDVNSLADYYTGIENRRAADRAATAAGTAPWLQPSQQPSGPMAFLRTGPGSGGMVPDTPDNRIRDLNQQIASTSLTQPEETRATALRNSLSRVQELVADGTLSRASGAQLTQQIQEHGEQLWARQGSLPEMIQRQQYLNLQRDSARRTAIANGDANAIAADVQRRIVDLGGGNRGIVGQDGSIQVIHDQPERQTPAQRRQAQQQDQEEKAWDKHGALVERLRGAVQREYDAVMTRRPNESEAAYDERKAAAPSWMGRQELQPGLTIDPVELETRRQIAAHYRHLGIPVPQLPSHMGGRGNANANVQPGQGGAAGGSGSGGTGGGGGPQNNAPPGMEPGGPTPAGREPARTPLQQGFNTMRVAVQNHPLASLRGDRNTLDRIDELEHLVQQHPNVGAMPIDNPVRRQYDELLHMIRRVVTQGRRTPAPQQRPTPTPPRNLSPSEAAGHISESGWAGGFSS